MKASKFIILAGGILGILAFFLPMVSVDQGDARATVSAFQIIKGLDQLTVATGDQEVQVALASAGASATAATDAVDGMKGIVMAIFVPALLLLLIGGVAVARHRLGRLAGASALVLGLVGLAIGMILKGAAEGDAGIGLTLLLVTGIAGVVGGLIALVRPERAVVAAPEARFAAAA